VDGENCIMKSFNKYYYDEVKTNEIGGTCSTHKILETLKTFRSESLKRECLSEHMGEEGKIMHVNKEETNAKLESPGLGYHPLCGSYKHDIGARIR
jgi:hypothetical protein